MLAANVVLAFALGAWFVANPHFESSLATPSEIDQLVKMCIRDRAVRAT